MTNGWKKLGWKPSDRMQSYGYRHHRIPLRLPRTSAHSQESVLSPPLPPSHSSLLSASPPFFTRLPQPSLPRPPFKLPLFFAGQFHLQPHLARSTSPETGRAEAHPLKPHRPSSTASSFVPFRRPLFPVSFCNCNFPCFARILPGSTAPRTGVDFKSRWN